jgi:hypothetical protein
MVCMSPIGPGSLCIRMGQKLIGIRMNPRSKSQPKYEVAYVYGKNDYREGTPRVHAFAVCLSSVNPARSLVCIRNGKAPLGPLSPKRGRFGETDIRTFADRSTPLG